MFSPRVLWMLCSSAPRERLRSGSRQQRKGYDGRPGRPFTSCDAGLPWGAATTFHWPLRPLHQGWGTEIFLSVSSFRTIRLDFFLPSSNYLTAFQRNFHSLGAKSTFDSQTLRDFRPGHGFGLLHTRRGSTSCPHKTIIYAKLVSLCRLTQAI